MHRETAHRSRRSRSLVVLLLALAIVAVFGIAAQQAMAKSDGSYNHDGATACTSCHDGSPSSAANATNAKCITCHTGYAAVNATKKCWTCHTPGQKMAEVKTGAPAICTVACHLANGTVSTHVAHVPDRGVCTTCHNLTTSATIANGSPHHTASTPTPTPTVTAKVTLKLSGLTSGAMKLGRRVTAKGRVTPTSLAGSQVKLTVQKKRSARWVTLKSVKRTISATGAYNIWKYKPASRGAYRMRATIAKTAAHTAARTKWRPFKVK